MTIRTLIASTALLAFACGDVSSQPTTTKPPGVTLPPPPPTDALPPPPPLPSVPPIPQEKSVDDLIADLERLRMQKAELEKKEQELTATLRKKLQMQTERLQKLGIAPKDEKRGEPDRVGRIILEGNAKKDEKKILDAVGMQPGQVLQYPELELARVKLEKAGFKSVTVEVIANELDSKFKDIRVRVDEANR